VRWSPTTRERSSCPPPRTMRMPIAAKARTGTRSLSAACRRTAPAIIVTLPTCFVYICTRPSRICWSGCAMRWSIRYRNRPAESCRPSSLAVAQTASLARPARRRSPVYLANTADQSGRLCAADDSSCDRPTHIQLALPGSLPTGPSASSLGRPGLFRHELARGLTRFFRTSSVSKLFGGKGALQPQQIHSVPATHHWLHIAVRFSI